MEWNFNTGWYYYYLTNNNNNKVDNYDSFLNAYNVYLCDKNNLISDNNEEGDIKFVDVKKVVIYCLSDDVPEFILDRFVELSRKFVNSGFIIIIQKNNIFIVSFFIKAM